MAVRVDYIDDSREIPEETVATLCKRLVRHNKCLTQNWSQPRYSDGQKYLNLAKSLRQHATLSESELATLNALEGDEETSIRSFKAFVDDLVARHPEVADARELERYRRLIPVTPATFRKRRLVSDERQAKKIKL